MNDYPTVTRYGRRVEITDSYYTGRHIGRDTRDRLRSPILPVLKRWVSDIAGYHARHVLYVGIGSGIDYWTALAKRVDKEKMPWRVTRMNLLYMSSVRWTTADIENELITHLTSTQAPERIMNAKGGGGGAHGAGPEYFVYLAIGLGEPGSTWCRRHNIT